MVGYFRWMAPRVLAASLLVVAAYTAVNAYFNHNVAYRSKLGVVVKKINGPLSHTRLLMHDNGTREWTVDRFLGYDRFTVDPDGELIRIDIQNVVTRGNPLQRFVRDDCLDDACRGAFADGRETVARLEDRFAPLIGQNPP